MVEYRAKIREETKTARKGKKKVFGYRKDVKSKLDSRKSG